MLNVAQTKAGSLVEDELTGGSSSQGMLLDQALFLRMIRVERKRTERSQRPFVLMLMDFRPLFKAAGDGAHFEKILFALSRSIRETDIKGWYEDGAVLGIVFTEIGMAEGKTVVNALLTKVTNALSTTLGIEHFNELRLSFHLYPEQANSNDNRNGGPTTPSLYPDLDNGHRGSRLIKRSMDIAGSLFALVILSPIFLGLAIAVRLTSKGPILFRQQRIGQHGRKFTFLKFRSMYDTGDHAIHKEYVQNLILRAKAAVDGQDSAVFKLTNDPRVTALGRFLRRSSLDELPQFLNVLLGDMSLVGPRPPIPYEFECYDLWHAQRLLAVKPGITGLWQVEGRSRVAFDDMVRLDLRYASSWSILLDLKILLKTPRAVLSGAGAY